MTYTYAPIFFSSRLHEPTKDQQHTGVPTSRKSDIYHQGFAHHARSVYIQLPKQTGDKTSRNKAELKQPRTRHSHLCLSQSIGARRIRCAIAQQPIHISLRKFGFVVCVRFLWKSHHALSHVFMGEHLSFPLRLCFGGKIKGLGGRVTTHMWNSKGFLPTRLWN